MQIGLLDGIEVNNEQISSIRDLLKYMNVNSMQYTLLKAIIHDEK